MNKLVKILGYNTNKPLKDVKLGEVYSMSIQGYFKDDVGDDNSIANFQYETISE